MNIAPWQAVPIWIAAPRASSSLEADAVGAGTRQMVRIFYTTHTSPLSAASEVSISAVRRTNELILARNCQSDPDAAAWDRCHESNADGRVGNKPLRITAEEVASWELQNHGAPDTKASEPTKQEPLITREDVLLAKLIILAGKPSPNYD